MTYSCVSALLQDSETASCCQWLCTRDDSVCAMDDTPSAWELGERGVRGWWDGFCVKSHLGHL